MNIPSEKKYLPLPAHQKGVSLIITFFVMILALAVVLAISTILYSQIQVIRNIGNSVISFYAADSGVEKVLFFDRQVIPGGAVRGLCSMVTQTVNPNDGSIFNYCAPDPGGGDASLSSEYCNAPLKSDPNGGDGCDPANCNSCQVSFTTKLSDNESYAIKAIVSPDADGTSTDLSVDSTGAYENVSRAINLYVSKSTQQPTLSVSSANIIDTDLSQGNQLAIEAEVKSSYGIAIVNAVVKTSFAATTGTTIPLTCDPTPANPEDRICCAGDVSGLDFSCAPSQAFATGNYYADIDVTDARSIEVTDSNILSDGTSPSFSVSP